MLSLASASPWKDLPVGNGPLTWIGLHRRITPLGDMYYSHDCQRLSDFKVAYWNSGNPYTEMDGDATSYCVYHQVLKSTSGGVTSYTHDYTRASCAEQHQFYCKSENGTCTFIEIEGYYGDTSQDFTPDNDVVYPYESDDKCAELCLDSFSVFPHQDLRVVEECWGFSTSGTECRLHNVLKPSYLNKLQNRISSANRKLFIKKCFSSAVNDNKFEIEEVSTEPNTTCGTPVMGNSTATSLQLFVYLGVWTWNEAFTTCKHSGLELLKVNQEDDYSAIQQLVSKYGEIQSMDYIWLGLHEPDPVNHTDIRVWSDCGGSVNTNWDPNSPPPPEISDSALCVVLDTTSNYWYTAMCNEQHYFVCTGEYGYNHSYTNGVPYTVGTEVTLGPYNVTEPSCKQMCSTLTYDNQECWGYAVLETDLDEPTVCYLYFINGSSPNILTETSIEHYLLFYKMIWSDTGLLHRIGDADNSLIPKSCCDVSGLKSECPVNSVPMYSESIPTTEKLEFVLYTNAVRWNEALAVCRTAGGTLLQPTDASKRVMLNRYMENWRTSKYISGEIWIGLSQLHADDVCSLRWASDCARPAWTDFTDDSYTEIIANYCIAIGSDNKFVKRSCDQTLQFVCEISAGTCDVSEMIPGINCVLGIHGASVSVASDTCLADCQVATYNNMECWAVVITAPRTCDLIFYVDPEYCKYNNAKKTNYDVIFKSCFIALVNELPPVVSTDASIFPKTSCFDLIPAEFIEAVCGITPTSTEPSTILPLQSSSGTQAFTTDTNTVSTHSSITGQFISSVALTPTSTPSVTSIHSTTSGFPVTSTQSMESASIPTTHISLPTSSIFMVSNNFATDSVKPIYIMPCLCNTQNRTNLTLEEWQEWFLLTNMIPKQNTSRFRRNLTSAKDMRTSALTIGIIASAVLLVLALYLVTTDIPRILKSASYIHGMTLKEKPTGKLYELEKETTSMRDRK